VVFAVDLQHLVLSAGLVEGDLLRVSAETQQPGARGMAAAGVGGALQPRPPFCKGDKGLSVEPVAGRHRIRRWKKPL